ncbi:MAG: aminotransferase class IV [Spirosomataceae bacterium]
MAAFFYLNGEIVPEAQAQIGITDLGLLRGYGIFDFFRAVDGQPIFMEDHLDRFENSARLLGLSIPQTRDHIRAIIHELIHLNQQPLLGIKMVLTGGYSPDGYAPAEQANLMMIAKPFKFMEAPNGLKFMTVNHQRQLAEVKSLDYLMPVYLLRKQKEVGANDVLYHFNGLVTESSRSNVFLVKDETVITPASGMLKGITRKHILAYAGEHFAVEERDVSLQEVMEADEIFTTGSSKKIVAVTRIDDHVVGDGKMGKVTQKLLELFQEHEIGVSV